MQLRGPVLLGSAFAALLLLVGFSAIAVWQSATGAQSRVAQLHDAHTRAAADLSAIRANVYLTGILTRDYLLDAAPDHVPDYVAQFREIQAETQKSFASLEASVSDAQQRAAVKRLEQEIITYWDPTEVALGWTPEEKRGRGASLLHQRVRRREEIFALARQAENLMTANFLRERERITVADREFRYSLGWTIGFALVLGFGIAGLTILRMIRLEAQSRTAESELRRLSGQLRTAQENERKYLSRELHDQVGQMLTGLKMELAALARANASSDPEVAGRITRAKGAVEQTLRVVRNIAMLLRPSMLDDLGLTPALAWHIKEFSRSSSVSVDSDIDPELDSLPDEYRTCIYRIIQEALTNCARHARARKVTVRLKGTPASVLVTVADDGIGFDTAAHRRAGLGLVGIGERVRELNGQLRVISSPETGTRVEVQLPRPSQTEDTHDSNRDRGRPRDRQDRVEASA
jgi:signal transduction histidine kinase